MKWIKRISLALLFLLLILLTIIGWIVTTQSGLHFALNTAVRWLPGLEIATMSGGWSDLNLQGVRYRTKGINVDVDKFNLSLQVNCLKRFQLCVNNISTEGVDVKIDSKAFQSAEEQASSKPLTKLSTPYPILLNQLTLKNISIQLDNTQVLLAELTMAADWQANLLTIKPTTINGLAVNLPKTTIEANKETEKTVIKTTNGIADKSPAETLKALFAEPLLAKLPEVVLPIDINIEQIRGINWHLAGDTKLFVANLTLIASVQNQQIAIKQFDVVAPEGKITLTGDANLAQQWPVNIAVQAVSYLNDLKGQQVDLKLEGALLQQLKLMLSFTGPIKANLVAEAALSQAGLPIQLTLESQQLNWPLQGEPEYRLKDLRLRLNGKVMNYDLSLRTQMDGRDVPPALLTLDAKGNEEQFRLTRLRLNALQGHTELSGIIDWSKAISWNGLLTLSNINTAKQWPQWPAKLQGKIVTTGSLHGGSWQLKIPEITLDGKVKGNLLQTRGQINGNAAGQWNISDFNILLGRNKLAINGHVSDKWQLDGIIDAPGLDGVLPGLAGVIKGQLKLRGDLKSPQLMVDLAARKVKWQKNLAIDKAIIQGDIRSDKQIHGQLTVAIHQLKQSDLVVHNFNLDAKGNEQQHSVKMNIDGKPIFGHLTLKGRFDRQKALWQGVLDNTLFNSPIGEWQLSRPVAIEYANQQQEVTLSPHCWINAKGRFCLSKTAKIGKSGNADILLQQFDLALLKPFLPAETQLTGSFDGDAKVSWYADGRSPQAKVNLLGNSVKIKQLIEGSVLPVEFQTLTLNADMSNGKAVLQWLIQINNNGKFSGNIRIDDLQQNRKLSGSVNIENISLALIRPVLSKGEKLDGDLNADLRLAGNMKQPLLNGNLALSNVAAKGHWFPFDINQGFLKLNFMGTHSQLTGRINTPEGYLKLTGEADWRNIKAWQARISATGNKLRITLPPMVRIDVEPDIVFEATPNLLSLNGNVNIPWARITVQELPESAVGVSSDEVMLDANLQPIEKKGISIPILTNLQIKIGNDVRLDAFGLKARLTGILKVIQDKQGLGLNGQINIPEGRFHAYGQDLIVRKGQILFSGPVDQPFLNVEAIRNPESTNDNVIAGVRVTGLADKPKATIFSEPVKSQQEALSYLLRGEGLDSSGADSTHMAALLISMGVSKSGKLLGSIGETFGVSDLALDTQGVGDKSQVVVSGKITNDLQVKYGVGIFNSLATLTLRYRLMPKLYLEAVSGVDQALDLLYQFEF
ncbi:translocation/assembly module TamB domain-containing protein [Arsenophonus apicola]|uniref:autotransporter assembly complex protein TamB n=1 Tax=Arsenophonus apicola TaxID=2879119 RepID=UPI00387991DE